MLWTKNENSIALKYSAKTILLDVSDILEDEFEKRHSENGQNEVLKIIHHVDETISKIVHEISMEDEAECDEYTVTNSSLESVRSIDSIERAISDCRSIRLSSLLSS